MKYDQKFKSKIVRYFFAKDLSISKVASKWKIPKQTLARWIKNYEKSGGKGLKNKKRGTKKIPLDADVERKILQLWKERKRSKYSMRKHLKSRNQNISYWTVDRIYKKNKLEY